HNTAAARSGIHSSGPPPMTDPGVTVGGGTRLQIYVGTRHPDVAAEVTRCLKGTAMTDLGISVILRSSGLTSHQIDGTHASVHGDVSRVIIRRASRAPTAVPDLRRREAPAAHLIRRKKHTVSGGDTDIPPLVPHDLVPAVADLRVGQIVSGTTRETDRRFCGHRDVSVAIPRPGISDLGQ